MKCMGNGMGCPIRIARSWIWIYAINDAEELERCLCTDFPEFEFVGLGLAERNLLCLSSSFCHAGLTICEIQELGADLQVYERRQLTAPLRWLDRVRG